jgi:hypothetical protein
MADRQRSVFRPRQRSVFRPPLQGDKPSSPETLHSTRDALWANFVSPAGYILAVSYPVLALSTGVRALYQLFFRDDIIYYLPVVLSGVAALCYLIATIGFVYRRRWSWWLSVSVLAFEMAMTLIVGVWSFVDPPFVGRTVWRRFGEDYGYFPLFQPFLGLLWLLWPQTMRAYGILGAQWQSSATASTQTTADWRLLTGDQNSGSESQHSPVSSQQSIELP